MTASKSVNVAPTRKPTSVNPSHPSPMDAGSCKRNSDTSCDQAGIATSTTLVVSAINTLFINDPNNLIVVGLEQLDYFTILALAVASVLRNWSKYRSPDLGNAARWLDVGVKPIQRIGPAILLNDSAMKTPQSARFRNPAATCNDANFLTHM